MPEPLDVDEMERLGKAATEPGWVVARETQEFGTIGGPVCYMDEDNSIVVGQSADLGPTADPRHDAHFIAYARNHWDAIVTELRELRAAKDQLTRERDEAREIARRIWKTYPFSPNYAAEHPWLADQSPDAGKKVDG